MSTTAQTKHLTKKQVQRRWYLLDADGVVLGRLASLAAELLRGKGKASYSPHMDQGDGVVVINADKIRLTGNKLAQKIDFLPTRYRGNHKYRSYGDLMKSQPERVIRLAVSGMLPKNRLRNVFIRRLKVSKGNEAQQKYVGAQSVDMTSPQVKSGGPYVPAAASQEKEKAVS